MKTKVMQNVGGRCIMGDVQVAYMAVNSTYTKLDLYRIFQHVKSQFQSRVNKREPLIIQGY